MSYLSEIKKLLKILLLLCIIAINRNISFGQSNPQPEHTYAKIGNGNFTDRFDDVLLSYLDFGDLTIKLSEDSVRVEMALKDLPETLIFNHYELGMDHLNYEWSLILDLDNTQSISGGDIMISVTHFKLKKEEVLSDLLSITQHDIWLFETDGKGATKVGNIHDIYISNKSITFRVPKRLNKRLNHINKNTNFYFRSFLNNGRKTYADYFPN